MTCLRLSPTAVATTATTFALGALTALGALIALGGRPGAAADADDLRIVILPIVVHSAAADASYVSRGIADMVSSRLEQTGRVEIVRVLESAAATTDLGEALRLGQERHGDFVVFGAFTQFGDGASLDVHCMPLRVGSQAEAAAARRIFIQSGVVGDMIPKLDAIVDRLAEFVDAPRPATATASAADARAPAASSEAMRALAQRLEALEAAVFGASEAEADAAAAAAEPDADPDASAAARVDEEPPPES